MSQGYQSVGTVGRHFERSKAKSRNIRLFYANAILYEIPPRKGGSLEAARDDPILSKVEKSPFHDLEY